MSFCKLVTYNQLSRCEFVRLTEAIHQHAIDVYGSIIFEFRRCITALANTPSTSTLLPMIHLKRELDTVQLYHALEYGFVISLEAASTEVLNVVARNAQQGFFLKKTLLERRSEMQEVLSNSAASDKIATDLKIATLETRLLQRVDSHCSSLVALTNALPKMFVSIYKKFHSDMFQMRELLLEWVNINPNEPLCVCEVCNVASQCVFGAFLDAIFMESQESLEICTIRFLELRELLAIERREAQTCLHTMLVKKGLFKGRCSDEFETDFVTSPEKFTLTL